MDHHHRRRPEGRASCEGGGEVDHRRFRDAPLGVGTGAWRAPAHLRTWERKRVNSGEEEDLSGHASRIPCRPQRAGREQRESDFSWGSVCSQVCVTVVPNRRALRERVGLRGCLCVGVTKRNRLESKLPTAAVSRLSTDAWEMQETYNLTPSFLSHCFKLHMEKPEQIAVV